VGDTFIFLSAVVCFTDMKHSVLGFFCLLLLLFPISSSSGQSRLGADLAVPAVNQFLTGLPLEAGTAYIFTETDSANIIDIAARARINVFELIDCLYRYLSPRNYRVSIAGARLRQLQGRYDFGGERVLSILSIEKLVKLETGAVFSGTENALDIYLDSGYETYIEIGTAIYDNRFGFKRLSPLLFSDAYGITVKKLFFSAPLTKLELFAPGKGAIYVKGISRPKKWNLNVITQRN